MHLIAELGSAPQEVGRVRRALTRALGDWGISDDSAEVAVLLTSELVTNAIKHAAGPIRVRAGVGHRGLRVEVDDDARGTVSPRQAELDDLDGRGLFLVDALSDRWGCRDMTAGKRVWFELRRPAESAAG